MKAMLTGIIGVLAIAGFLSTGLAYAQSDLSTITQQALDNSDKLKELTKAITSCTNSLKAYDTSLLEECGTITSTFNTHITQFLDETQTERDTVTSKYPSYSSSFGLGSSLYD